MIRKGLVATIVLTFCFFSGCGSNNEITNVKKMTESTNIIVEESIAPKEEIVTVGAKEEPISPKDGDTITICTEEIYFKEIQAAVEAWHMIYPNVDAKIVRIPNDYDNGQIVLTELRTKIMSGEGPDVYVIDAKDFGGGILSDALFLYPDKAMNSGLFMNLDEYLLKARYINMENYNETIINIGKNNGAQYIIPIDYNFSLFIENQEYNNEGNDYPIEWNAIMQTENKDVYRMIGNELNISRCFKPIVDYNTKSIALSKNEIKESFINFKTMYQKYIQSNIEDNSTASRTIRSSLIKAKEDDCFWAIPNSLGGITAMVNLYAAIDANTKYPESAFSFLDVLLSDEIMSGKGFDKNGYYYGTVLFPLAVPTNSLGYAHYFEKFRGGRTKKEKADKMVDRIDAAMFYSPVNNLIDEAYFQYLRADDDRTIDDIVENLYNRIWMEINE